MKVAVIYWGQKGGGPRQTLNLAHTAKEADLDVAFFLSENNELIDEILKTRIEVVQSSIPKNRIESLISLKRRKFTVDKTLDTLQKLRVERVFFLLPHPWDIPLAKKITRETNIQVWRAIHDARRHPGDLWPTSFTIRKMIKFCNQIVTYSDFVSKQLGNAKKAILKTHIYERGIEPKSIFEPGSVLFVGRIRKYKGLDLLAKTWPLVELADKKLTIAGQGNLPSSVLEITDKLINRWLSNAEILDLIRKSQLVVLPYIEASQSGIIPLANSLSTPVVITPVGGLTEQVENGVNGLIAQSLSPRDLARAISEAFNYSWSFTRSGDSTRQFLRSLTKEK